MIYVLSRSSDLFRAPTNIFFIYLLPVIVVSILCFSYFTFLSGLVLFLLALLFMHLCVRLSDLIKSTLILNSLKRKFNSKIIKFSNYCDFEDFFGSDIGRRLSHMITRNSLCPRHNHTFLFSVETNSNSQVFGTFSVNISPNITFLFHPYQPGDLNPTRTLVLFHEIGHSSSNSWYRTREYIIRAISSIIIVCILLVNSFSYILLPIFLALIISQLMIKFIFRFKEEIEADKTSLKIFVDIFDEVNDGKRSEGHLMIFDHFIKILERERINIPKDRWMFNLYNDYRNKAFSTILNPEITDEKEFNGLMRPINLFHLVIQFGVIFFTIPFIYLIINNSVKQEFTTPFFFLACLSILVGILIIPVLGLLVKVTEQFSMEFSTASAYNRNKVKDMLYLGVVVKLKQFGNKKEINKIELDHEIIERMKKNIDSETLRNWAEDFDKRIKESILEETGQERPTLDDIRNNNLGRDNPEETED